MAAGLAIVGWVEQGKVPETVTFKAVGAGAYMVSTKQLAS